MMKHLFAVVLFSLLSIQSSFANSSLLIDSVAVEEMQQVAENILNDLKEAKGILPTQPPYMKVEPFSGSIKIAQLDYEEKLIKLDIKTYNECLNVSSGHINALAFIIGHELGHYIHAHKQPSHADKASLKAGLDAGEKPVFPGFPNRYKDAIEEYAATREEAEADLEGAFLGYLAGYDPMAAGEELLDSIYKKKSLFNLTEDTQGYPSLDERKAIIENTGRELAELTPMFETAKYLSAIGQYADAVAYLEEITEKFQSREIYNNIGVLYILNTLQIIPDTITIYEFPVIFDADFRAPHLQFISEETLEENQFPNTDLLDSIKLCVSSIHHESLDKAEGYFKKATGLDANYAIATLNLSIAQTIKGLLYEGQACTEFKKQEFIKAKATAFDAIKMAEKDLNGFSLEHYNFVPTDQLQAFSFPSSGRKFRFLTAVSDTILTDTGILVTIKFINPFPIFKEEFGSVNLADMQDTVIDHKTLYSRWSHKDTLPENIVPDEALLISNINVQLDLAKIFLDELTPDRFLLVPSRKRSGLVKVIPFARALELNHNNSIAKRNLAKFQGISSTNLNNVGHQNNRLSQQIIKFNSRDVSTLQSSHRGGWHFSKTVDTSRLTSFYKNGNILIGEKNKLFYHKVPTTQTLNYRNNLNSRSGLPYEMYSSESFVKDDGRLERSVFLVPGSFDSLQLDSVRTVMVGMHADSLRELIGWPNSTINLNRSGMDYYETYREQFLYQSVNDTSTGTRVIIDFRQLVDLTLDSITTSIEIDETKSFEFGLIFEYGKDNLIEKWVYYYRQINSQGVKMIAERAGDFFSIEPFFDSGRPPPRPPRTRR